MDAKRKRHTVLKDIRKHYLLASQDDLADAAGLSKRTVKRIEHRDSVRESTQLAIVHGLNKLLTKHHGKEIRLTAGDIFGEDDRALPSMAGEGTASERSKRRKDYCDRLIESRVAERTFAVAMAHND